MPIVRPHTQKVSTCRWGGCQAGGTSGESELGNYSYWRDGSRALDRRRRRDGWSARNAGFGRWQPQLRFVQHGAAQRHAESFVHAAYDVSAEHDDDNVHHDNVDNDDNDGAAVDDHVVDLDYDNVDRATGGSRRGHDDQHDRGVDYDDRPVNDDAAGRCHSARKSVNDVDHARRVAELCRDAAVHGKRLGVGGDLRRELSRRRRHARAPSPSSLGVAAARPVGAPS